jgi:hypothetical protein
MIGLLIAALVCAISWAGLERCRYMAVLQENEQLRRIVENLVRENRR